MLAPIYAVIAIAVMLCKAFFPGPALLFWKVLPVGLLASVSVKHWLDARKRRGELPAGVVSRQRWVTLGLCLSAVADGAIELSFVAGLVFFLFSHLCYLMMMGGFRFSRQQAYWVGVTFAYVLVVLTLIWQKLPTLMVGPVMAYMLVIGLMISRASFRAVHLRRSTDTLLMAVGAWSYAVSDGLIALNRWYEPLPYPPLWILSTYFLAQGLIFRSSQVSGFLADEGVS